MLGGVGYIEMGDVATGFSLIYRIDDEPGLGDTIPNRGDYSGGDVVIVDDTGFFFPPQVGLASIPSADMGADAEPWTFLWRIGDFAASRSDMIALAGPFISTNQTATSAGLYDLDTFTGWWNQITVGSNRGFPGGPINDSLIIWQDPSYSNPSSTYITDTIFMLTIDSVTGDYRMIETDGVSVSTFDAGTMTPPTAPPTLNVLLWQGVLINGGVGFTYEPWARSFNGYAVWRELCSDDAAFIALHDEFMSA